jgi:hypothetical protein
VAELTLKERCQRRLEGMKTNRQDYESEAKEIASYAMPARSRWLASDTNKRRTPNKRLNNGHGITAFRTLQNGMASGLTSQSRPWFTLKSGSDELNDQAEVRGWLDDVQRILYNLFASTNFYGAMKTGYLELGGFGTNACIMVEHPEEVIVCHQLTFGEYWLGMGTNLQPDSLYRECPISARNAVRTFGEENLSEAVVRLANAPNTADETVTFYHAIEPNDEYEAGYSGSIGKPWRSVYWDAKDGHKDRVIQRNGFDEQPFWAPRWDTTGGDVWGQGPGHDALPDLRELQLQAKRKAEATDFHIHPEIIASARAKMRRQPKNVVTIAGQDLDISKLVHVPYEVPYQSISVIREDLEQVKRDINDTTFADLFMAITNMNGVQPRNMEEIAARNEEKLTQLGPVIERVNNEMLEPAINRAFAIAQRMRLLPPAPQAMMDNPDFDPEFVSTLTMMQRMVGLGQSERAIGFVGGLLGAFPEVRHKIDAYELVDDYWARSGAPAKALRSTEDANEDADTEAQNAQMAQAAEAAGKAAPAASVGVDAAELLSKTPGMAPPAVADLVPLIPR